MLQFKNGVLYSLFWEITQSPNFMCLLFGTPCPIFIRGVMEQAVSSETSAH